MLDVKNNFRGKQYMQRLWDHRRNPRTTCTKRMHRNTYTPESNVQLQEIFNENTEQHEAKAEKYII